MTGIGERLEALREERWGMLADLVFAIIWVTLVDVIFRFLEGPQWAYYLFMFAGIIAYFGFFASLDLARSKQ
ncbi:hypothetical protein HT576_09300 [Haloterrigena sp. SYSU A121-1]|uniref:DUF8119 domain-containing protein n=1 Tax=Haloterrigena gelatinilytica TaxID=2741724 RepID=A0A8J8GKE6_9EURY|nr:hypothetical protein [Haloterrigena gelatinilytica]NUB91216.1 hypothetical protein [Haloterrigena gelatinilytica]